MKIKSYFTDNERPVFITILGSLFAASIGLSVIIFSDNLSFVTTPLILACVAASLLIFVEYKIYAFLLYISSFTFLFSFLHPAFGLMRFIFLFMLALSSIYLTRKHATRSNIVAAGFCLIAFYSIATSFTSFYPTISLLKGLSLLVFSIFLQYGPFAIQLTYPEIGAKKFFLRMFLHISIIIVISNTIHFLVAPGSSFLAGRFSGWFHNPNSIGATYGIFVIPILTYEIGRLRFGFAKTGLLLTFLVAVLQLFSSQSRAGILSMLASWSVLLLCHNRQKKRLFYLISIIIIGFTIFITSSSNWENSLLHSLVYRNEIAFEGSGRLLAMTKSWNAFKKNPIFGSGIGVADTRSNRDTVAFSSSGFQTEKSNSFLAALEELGIVGFAILTAALLLPTLRVCWNQFRSHSSTNDRMNSIFCAILVAGFFNANFEAWLISAGSVICFFFWIIASILLMKEADSET